LPFNNLSLLAFEEGILLAVNNYLDQNTAGAVAGSILEGLLWQEPYPGKIEVPGEEEGRNHPAIGREEMTIRGVALPDTEGLTLTICHGYY
jgi:hypothetical protein